MRSPFLIACLVVFAFSTGSVTAEAESPSETQRRLIDLGFRVFKNRVEAPDFELENLQGETVTLSSYRGDLVFLNFWATWCPPCRAEMPSMQTLYEALEDDNFEVLAVDLQEPKRTVTDFVEERGFTFPVLLDTNGRVGAAYGARSIPTSFLIDPDGMAVGYLVGSRTWDEESVESLFRELSSD